MKDKSILQSYINDYRRHFSKYLKPGIGLKSIVHPAKGAGAIIEFIFIVDGKNEDEFLSNENNILYALKKIKQNAFAGELQGFKFLGTNLIFEAGRIIVIKGEDAIEQYSDRAAFEDVEKVVSQATGSQK